MIPLHGGGIWEKKENGKRTECSEELWVFVQVWNLYI